MQNGNYLIHLARGDFQPNGLLEQQKNGHQDRSVLEISSRTEVASDVKPDRISLFARYYTHAMHKHTCMLELPRGYACRHDVWHQCMHASHVHKTLAFTPGIISGQPFCHRLIPARDAHGVALIPEEDPNAFSWPRSHPRTLAKSPVVSDPML